MFKTIDANLMVESVEKTIEFYESKLGFKAVATVPDEKGTLIFVILAKDNITLMAQEKKSLTEEYPILETDKIRPSISLYITVDDVDSLYEELRSKTKILADMHTTMYKSKEFAIADNNGYVLTFAEMAEN